MTPDLRVDGILYLSMKEGETAEEAEDRFLKLLKSVGIEYSEYDASVDYTSRRKIFYFFKKGRLRTYAAA